MLTDAKIRNAKERAKLTDAGGLHLEVMPSGSKLWRYRYRIAKKENVFALARMPKSRAAGADRRRALNAA